MHFYYQGFLRGCNLCLLGGCFFCFNFLPSVSQNIAEPAKNAHKDSGDIIAETADSVIFLTGLRGKGFLFNLSCDDNISAVLDSKLRQSAEDASKISLKISTLAESCGFQNGKTRYVRIAVAVETGLSDYLYLSKENREGTLPALSGGSRWYSGSWRLKKTKTVEMRNKIEMPGNGVREKRTGTIPVFSTEKGYYVAPFVPLPPPQFETEVLEIFARTHPEFQFQLWPFYEMDGELLPLQDARWGIQLASYLSCSHMARLHDPFSEKAKYRRYLYSVENWFVKDIGRPILVKEYRIFYVCYDLKTKERKIGSIIHSYCGKNFSKPPE